MNWMKFAGAKQGWFKYSYFRQIGVCSIYEDNEGAHATLNLGTWGIGGGGIVLIKKHSKNNKTSGTVTTILVTYLQLPPIPRKTKCLNYTRGYPLTEINCSQKLRCCPFRLTFLYWGKGVIPVLQAGPPRGFQGPGANGKIRPIVSVIEASRRGRKQGNLGELNLEALLEPCALLLF